MKWLQCYYQDGMSNLVDHNGRTIWFNGPAGPMKPSNSKTRGKRSTKKKDSDKEYDYSATPAKIKKEIKKELKAQKLNDSKKQPPRAKRNTRSSSS